MKRSVPQVKEQIAGCSKLLKDTSQIFTSSNNYSVNSSMNFLDPTCTTLKSPRSKNFPTELLLESIEKDLKELDDSFAFQWDDELSMIYAAKCLKQATQKILQEKKDSHSLSKTQDNYDSKYLLLKKLETQLKIKEKNLHDSEKNLEQENVRLEQLSQKLFEENLKIKAEKTIIEESYAKINEENLKVGMQMKKLDEKYAEIIGALQNYDIKELAQTAINSSIYNKEGHQEFDISLKLELEKKARRLEEFEQELKERENRIKNTEYSQGELAEALQKTKKELKKLAKKQEDQIRNEALALSQKKLSMEAKERELDFKVSELNRELINIENMKNDLRDCKDKIINEQQDFKENYSVKIGELIKAHEMLGEKLKSIAEKEEKLDSSLNDAQKKHHELEEKDKILQKIEKPKEKFEKLRMEWEDMQSDYYERSLALEITEKSLKDKETVFLLSHSNDNEGLAAFHKEINLKIDFLHKEEQEMLRIQKFSAQLKEDNEITSSLLHKMHEDLIKQQDEFFEEQENLKKRKETLQILIKSLDPEGSLASSSSKV
ncbi:hypothetical protein SteCoe_376 [Stentor coeruleus]|uniref:Uncharacterized protein n=1 Tax=Stentor coeruleus TaxID=5963 RepID=A0A1R2D413_9CILI|nr:hypothetical protein SteCoe_376 [Stentor coeruleus]